MLRPVLLAWTALTLATAVNLTAQESACDLVADTVKLGYEIASDLDDAPWFKEKHTEAEKIEMRHERAKIAISAMSISSDDDIRACRSEVAGIDVQYLFILAVYAETKLNLAINTKSKGDAKSAQLDAIDVCVKTRVGMEMHPRARDAYESVEKLCHLIQDQATAFIVGK